MTGFWTLVFYLCFFLTFFSKEIIIINIERNLFVLQTKNSVKKINSVKANFDFFIRKKVFGAARKLLNFARIKFGTARKKNKFGADLIWQFLPFCANWAKFSPLQNLSNKVIHIKVCKNHAAVWLKLSLIYTALVYCETQIV